MSVAGAPIASFRKKQAGEGKAHHGSDTTSACKQPGPSSVGLVLLFGCWPGAVHYGRPLTRSSKEPTAGESAAAEALAFPLLQQSPTLSRDHCSLFSAHFSLSCWLAALCTLSTVPIIPAPHLPPPLPSPLPIPALMDLVHGPSPIAWSSSQTPEDPHLAGSVLFLLISSFIVLALASLRIVLLPGVFRFFFPTSCDPH